MIHCSSCARLGRRSDDRDDPLGIVDGRCLPCRDHPAEGTGPTPVDTGCRDCGRTDTYRVNGLCPGCDPGPIPSSADLAERLRADNAALLAHNLAACAPATPRRPWRNGDWRFDPATRHWTTADDPLADLSWLHAAAPGPRH